MKILALICGLHEVPSLRVLTSMEFTNGMNDSHWSHNLGENCLQPMVQLGHWLLVTQPQKLNVNEMSTEGGRGSTQC